MQLLWNCLRENEAAGRTAAGTAQLSGSVPFREQWTKQVLED
ncbi:MAG: hypothetical protein ACLT29_00485 [Ruminococcus callidus]